MLIRREVLACNSHLVLPILFYSPFSIPTILRQIMHTLCAVFSGNKCRKPLKFASQTSSQLSGNPQVPMHFWGSLSALTNTIFGMLFSLTKTFFGMLSTLNDIGIGGIICIANTTFQVSFCKGSRNSLFKFLGFCSIFLTVLQDLQVYFWILLLWFRYFF